MRIVPIVGALMLASSVALAQQKPANPDANTPAVSTPNTKNSNAPVEGANSFTEGQALARDRGGRLQQRHQSDKRPEGRVARPSHDKAATGQRQPRFPGQRDDELTISLLNVNGGSQ